MDTQLKIGIVGHESRIINAYNLFRTTQADYISVDNGNLGCDDNHRAVWSATARMAADDEWIIVCEDDAKPVPHFNIQAQAALDNTPKGVDVVSFYMGRMRPSAWQPRMKNAVAQANRGDINWITSNATLHAVCLAIRGPRRVADMLDTTAVLVRPIDERITMWCRRFGHTVAYSHPSLVEHADETPCITARFDGAARERGRVAWQVGERRRWTAEHIPLSG